MKPYDYGPLYWTYAGMKNRCYNHNHPSYAKSGGQGIKVCDRWLERVTGFANFVADMGERPLGCTLARLNDDGDYTPENCHWAAAGRQGISRRKRTTNTSGITGVYYHKKFEKWHSTMTIDKKRKHLGWFDTRRDAAYARALAEARYTP